MHILLHLIPGYCKPGPVGAEHGSSWVIQIPIRIIPGGPDHFFLIMTGLVILNPQRQAASSPGVCRHLPLVIPKIYHRPFSRKNRRLFLGLRRIKDAAFSLKICHGPSQILCRKLHAKSIIRLQQTAFSRSQPLTQCPVGSLAEVSSLSVLNMCPSSQQRDPHIRNLRPGHHSPVAFFLQMGKNQTLPVPIQHILTAGRMKLQAAAWLTRLQKKMHLRIMAQRLKMSHSLHRLQNRLLIHNVPCAKFHRKAISLPDQCLQNINLHVAHDLGLDFSCRFLPQDMKLRLLLFQLAQIPQTFMDIFPLRQKDPIRQNRLQNRKFRGRLFPQPLTCPGRYKSRHRTYGSCLRLLDSLIFSS